MAARFVPEDVRDAVPEWALPADLRYAPRPTDLIDCIDFEDFV